MERDEGEREKPHDKYPWDGISGVRPFFCQIEAVEAVIWLTEVAPNVGSRGKRFIEHLANANNDANPELMRLALKLATGAGKTIVVDCDGPSSSKVCR